MMENKQTAVEWMFHSLWEEPKDKMTWHSILEKAKDMEKYQIIDAYDDAYIAMNLSFRGFDRSVEYYEKTYGTQNNGKPEELP
jgi:hypothetical protein